MRGLIRAILTVVLARRACGPRTAPIAKADVEMLMVPSAAMGRDIPVAFQGGGPHAVVLLDAFNAAPDVSNWVTAGNAMNTLAGKGISVAAPAGGAWSMYTNWEQDGGRQWETFLADELPDWLAANKGLAPGGHGIVGAAQGGYRRDDAWRRSTRPLPLRRLAVGLPAPRRTRIVNGAITAGLAAVRRCGHPQHVGSATAGPVEVARRRMCTCSCWPTTTPGCGCSARPLWRCSDPAAMIGYCDIRPRARNRAFYQHYRSVGGHNGHFDFPRRRQPRLGQLVRTAGGDVGRTRRHHQVGTVSVTGSAVGQPVPWRSAARGTATGRSSKGGRQPRLLVASSAALLTGCSVADDMMATSRAADIRDRSRRTDRRCAATGTAAAERGLERDDRDRAAARISRRARRPPG